MSSFMDDLVRTCVGCGGQFLTTNPNAKSCGRHCKRFLVGRKKRAAIVHAAMRSESWAQHPSRRNHVIGLLTTVEFNLLDALDVLGGRAHPEAIGRACGMSLDAVQRAIYRVSIAGLVERERAPEVPEFRGPVVRANRVRTGGAGCAGRSRGVARKLRTANAAAGVLSAPAPKTVPTNRVTATRLGRRLYLSAVAKIDAANESGAA